MGSQESWNSNSSESWRNVSLGAAGHGNTKGGETRHWKRRMSAKRLGFTWKTCRNANWELPRGSGGPRPFALPGSPALQVLLLEGSTQGLPPGIRLYFLAGPVMRRPYQISHRRERNWRAESVLPPLCSPYISSFFSSSFWSTLNNEKWNLRADILWQYVTSYSKSLKYVKH